MYTSDELLKLIDNPSARATIPLDTILKDCKKELEDIKSGKSAIGRQNREEVLTYFIKKAEKVMSIRNSKSIAKSKINKHPKNKNSLLKQVLIKEAIKIEQEDKKTTTKETQKFESNIKNKIYEYKGISMYSLELLIEDINNNAPSIAETKEGFIDDLNDEEALLMEHEEAIEFGEVLIEQLEDIENNQKEKDKLTKLIRSFVNNLHKKK